MDLLPTSADALKLIGWRTPKADDVRPSPFPSCISLTNTTERIQPVSGDFSLSVHFDVDTMRIELMLEIEMTQDHRSLCAEHSSSSSDDQY